MLVKRKINGLNVNIDISKRANIYFDSKFASKISHNSLGQILDSIYDINKYYIPLAVTWEITNICNFSCPFCYINTTDMNKNSLDFSKIYKDIDTLVDRGLLICYLTGGEAMMNPDFIKIYTYLKEKGVLVAILTNLSLLTEEHLELFKKYPPYKITVSIYGITQQSFSKTTGCSHYSYKTILENIIKLKKAGINVNCQTPINSFTIYDYIKIAKWCERNNIKYTCSNELNPTYKGIGLEQYQVSDEEFKKHHAQVNRVNVIKSDEKPIISELKAHKYHFDCRAGKHTFVISYDYKMRPCFIMYGENDPMFTIETSISDTLDEMIEYLEFYKTKIIDYCNGCVAASICNECMHTQNKQENLSSYMQKKCRDNHKTYKKLFDNLPY